MVLCKGPWDHKVPNFKTFFFSYKHEALTLNQLMDELEDRDRIPLSPSGISINIFPPEDEILTDEDSGKEDNVEMQKLPAAKLRAEAEFYISSNEEGDGYESEDNLPLSNFINKNKIKSQDNFFSAWSDDDEANNNANDTTNLTKVFDKLIDDDLIDLLVAATNR